MSTQILVIKGEFTWRQLGRVLGRPVYRKAYETKEVYPCRLAGGKVSYKIYNGIGGSSGGSAHVCLHSDGVCFTPSLQVDCDRDLAQTLYDKVKVIKSPSAGSEK